MKSFIEKKTSELSEKNMFSFEKKSFSMILERMKIFEWKKKISLDIKNGSEKDVWKRSTYKDFLLTYF